VQRLAVLAVLAGCNLADTDPAALIAARVPASEACGVAGWDGAPSETVRRCVLGAMATGRPFHALADAPVADGRDAVGWASDGVGFVRLDYEATYGMFPGTDTEDLRWTDCAYLEARSPTCPTLDGDLCLACVPN